MEPPDVRIRTPWPKQKLLKSRSMGKFGEDDQEAGAIWMDRGDNSTFLAAGNFNVNTALPEVTSMSYTMSDALNMK